MACTVSRQIIRSAIDLGRRYEFDEPHARQVCRLALRLFDELRELHGLGEEERRILLAAGLLHDIGQHVSYHQHHKHSRYLILHSQPRGLTPWETELVALVATVAAGLAGPASPTGAAGPAVAFRHGASSFD